ncbi:EsaB/YukD family protein [Virgibacillus sp. 179-BFC.A HS]|uniref:EsaB/YukD family protein n=1 Tax=Tigheibacillus jepli TaxID=3035914 RepID=A0ABU5CEE1_9BACI|nr:EsaB/YukD family protein [Virgibacillus sp. 179-BFC.A HS]MDY0404683.1 EsaB/YukD family protein [Virgibacillus sp. 179-BFC.A HS]
MYIQITTDLKNYDRGQIELKLSDQHTVKKLVDIAWQTANPPNKPREGFWIRVANKDKVFYGTKTLAECGIMTGDKVEIL